MNLTAPAPELAPDVAAAFHALFTAEAAAYGEAAEDLTSEQTIAAEHAVTTALDALHAVAPASLVEAVASLIAGTRASADDALAWADTDLPGLIEQAAADFAREAGADGRWEIGHVVLALYAGTMSADLLDAWGLDSSLRGIRSTSPTYTARRALINGTAA